jgi:hypothetical protein
VCLCGCVTHERARTKASKQDLITPPPTTKPSLLRPHFAHRITARCLPLASYHIPRTSDLSHGEWHRLGASLHRLFKPPHARDAARQQSCQRRRGEPSNAARPLRHFASLAHTVQQISACAFSALFSATFFLLDYRLLLWRRSGKQVDGDRVWKNLRRFSGCMFASCVAGIISFSFNLQSATFFHDAFEPGITRRRSFERFSAFSFLLIPVDIFLPVQLLCFICALMTLLQRVSDHASHSYYNVARDRNRRTGTTGKIFDWRDCIGEYALHYWVRSMHVIAMVACSLLLVARCVAAGFRAEVAGLLKQAAASTDVNGGDTDTSRSYINTTVPNAVTNKAKQRLQQMLLKPQLSVFVSSGFVLFFPAIIVMFRRVERKMEGLILEMDHRSDAGNAFLPVEFSPRAADGSVTQTEMPIVEVRQYLRDIEAAAALQRRRFVFCLLLVTVALIALALRAVFVAFFMFDSQFNRDCGPCESCQEVAYFMLIWYNRFSFPRVFLFLCL